MRSVLLIDDDDGCNFIMLRTLKIIASDLEILTAKNGKEAICIHGQHIVVQE